jgi:MFS family permease
MMAPQVISFIQISFLPRERAVAMSYYVVTLGVASILGLILGGGLISANIMGMGWRSIFLINIPIGCIVLIAAGLLIHESKGSGTRSLDYGGVALLTFSLALLIFPLVLGGNTGWPLWTRICLLLSLPCFLVFWLYERRMSKLGKIPLITPTLFRLRRFAVGNVINLLNGILWNGLLFLFSIYLQTTLHFTPLQSGLSMVVGSIAFILASSASIVIVRRLGRWNLSTAAGIITLGSFLVLLAAQFLVVRWGVFPVLIAFFVLAFGQALFYTPLMPTTLADVTSEHAGAASGIYTTVLEVSASFGVALIGMLYAVLMTSEGSALEAFVLTMLLITLGSLGTIGLVQFLVPRKAGAGSISTAQTRDAV